jgi:hypothetical protein
VLIQPPGRQSQGVRDSPGLFHDDSVRQEPRIDIAGDAGGVVSQCHGSTAHNKHISDNALRARRSPRAVKGTLKFCPAEEDIISLTHAASRSLADT